MGNLVTSPNMQINVSCYHPSVLSMSHNFPSYYMANDCILENCKGDKYELLANFLTYAQSSQINEVKHCY